ncbi:MAG TPA: NAD(P)-dependent oxidoreductase [Planctomycetota bacterium]|nr:NAD(P)-dependent oxidoreductase [Planctomycetota bacterium]HRR81905.1 NAD(P)-dependent oxidoreductase [Planctomycetota bacterium]HRT93712.1 NAD(P)-dependent oxidoreductase [Planctomycetota bacterium]
MATILLHERVSQAWFDALAAFLREHQPEGLPLELAQCDDGEPEAAGKLLETAHVLVTGLSGARRPLTRETLEKARELRLVLKVGSRTAGVDLAAAREAGVHVSLCPAPAHTACAEHTILLLLALAKKLIPAHQRVVRRPLKEAGPAPRKAADGAYAYNWAGLDGIGLVHNKTLGFIGMGDVAIETAHCAAAFGMKLVYYDKERLSEEEEAEMGLGRRELDDLLREADFVSLHAALTPETANLVNADRLALMKPTAFLVNTARGGLVDEAALADALREGRLGGAAIDAWAVEPTPRDNPLLKLDNVVATPHVAAGTLSKTALFEAILPDILAALRGECPEHSCTPELDPKPAVPLQPPAPKAGPEAGAPEAPPAAEAPQSGEAAPEQTEGGAAEKGPSEGA